MLIVLRPCLNCSSSISELLALEQKPRKQDAPQGGSQSTHTLGYLSPDKVSSSVACELLHFIHSFLFIFHFLEHLVGNINITRWSHQIKAEKDFNIKVKMTSINLITKGIP